MPGPNRIAAPQPIPATAGSLAAASVPPPASPPATFRCPAAPAWVTAPVAAGVLREALLERVFSTSSATAEDWARLQAQWAVEDAAWLAEAHEPEPPTAEELAELGPDCGRPDGEYAWLALLPGPLQEEYFAATRGLGVPEALKAKYWDRSAGRGTGFASGGSADALAAGPVLARLADRAWDAGLRRLSDDELIGVTRAGRRLASWAAALELAATADLMRRRLAEEQAGETGVAEHADAELAAALTLTARAAGRQLELAWLLARLPLTSNALAEGRIDLPKAMVIADETSALSPQHRAAVEQHVLRRAAGQTRSQLRACVRRAVIAADPASVRRRQQQAQRDARVERWAEDAGTASLAGRDLPPAEVLAADHHLSALARGLKHAGVDGAMDQLRAKVFLALLAGQDPHTLLPTESAVGTGDATGDTPSLRGRPTVGASGHAGAAGTTASRTEDAGRVGCAGRGGAAGNAAGPGPTDDKRGAGRPTGAGLRGLGPVGAINLTLPLATWLGLSQMPGDVAGYGPLGADDSRDLAAGLAANPATRWCLTLTDAHGYPAAHGCLRIPPDVGPPRPHRPAGRTGPTPGTGGTDPPPGTGGTDLRMPSVSLEWLETGVCSHQRQSGSYRPPPLLQHLIHVRQRTCAFPGCLRPAMRCDQEHTTPYHKGGKTCECNLAPICRHHHEVKQTHGWHLEQTQPGVLTWTTPSGRTYTTCPTTYPL